MNVQNNASVKRIISIDALRGFDMFWIMGGDYLFRSFRSIHKNTITEELYKQMEHVSYEGFHFYDLIFPLFLFIVGISITLSLSGKINSNRDSGIYKRIISRTLILFLLGVFYMGGIEHGIKNIYLVGVLQRISIAYLFGAFLFCLLKKHGLIITTCVLLLGYYLILAVIPVPGFGEPSFEQGRNLAYYIDQWLPGQKFEGTILSTLGAVANVLIGIITGYYVKNSEIPGRKKVILLLGAGLILLFVGYVWGIWCPIIKAIWTSSYVLVACGYGLLLLALFYQIIEVWNYKKWAEPFIWIGMNPITIYVAASVLRLRKLSFRIVGGEVMTVTGIFSDLIVSLVTLMFVFLLAHFLFKKKIFIRV